MVINKRVLTIFWIILGLTLSSLLVNLPPQYQPSVFFSEKLALRYGLDLAGGVALLYDIDTSQTKNEDLSQALESLKSNIERRVNLFGVSEANVQLSKQNNQHRLHVELPGLTNVDDAVNLIGQTAQLKFFGLKDLPKEAS